MSNWEKMILRKAINFNPVERLEKGVTAKKIPMTNLIEFQKKITGFEFSKYKSGPKFQNNDTLFAKITPCLENGKTAYVDILDDNETAFGSSEFIVLRKTKFTDSEFIYYLSISPTFRNRAISCMEGTSGRQRANENTLKNFELPIPPLDKQKQIAKVLSDIDAKIDLNQKINTELEAMAKTIYDYWFVQFDFPDKNGKPYKSSGGKMIYNEELKREIPEGWEVKGLLDIADFTNGIACQKYRPDNNDYLPVIKIKEMRDGFTNKTEKVKKAIPEKVKIFNGDVLFSWSASLEVMLWAGGEGGLNQHIFKVTSNKYPRSYYFYEVLNYLKYFKKVAELRKTTMGHITREHLKDSLIAVPPIDLTYNLDKKLDSILEKIIINKEENQKLTTLRDWLLPMLMNGQVSVKESDNKRDSLSVAAEPQPQYGQLNFPKKNGDDFSEQIAAIVLQEAQRNDGYVHGKTGIQKTSFFAKVAFNERRFQNTNFKNYYFGTYSEQIEAGIKDNPYLVKTKVSNNKEVYKIAPQKKEKLLSWLNSGKNESYKNNLDQILEVYQDQLINNDIYRIELLNTVYKIILDHNTSDLNTIWEEMESWYINKEKTRSKANKFKKTETIHTIHLIKRLGWI